MTTPTPAQTPRRRPFAAIRKGIVEHVLSGRLNATQLGVYVWLHLTAEHKTGTAWTSATKLATELGLYPSTVREILASLRRDGYLVYECRPGGRGLYEITIVKYHAHFRDERRPVGRQDRRQLRQQLRRQVRAVSACYSSENESPKKKEGRRNVKTPLRVRFADPDRSGRDLLLRSQTRTREDAPGQGDAVVPDDVPVHADTLTREDALAQTPAVMRETLELFLLKTGRETITPAELDALRAMEAAHTPAVIQRAITRAVERLARRGEPASALTLAYVQQSLQHFTTRAGTGARREAVPQPSYPTGLTRLW